MAGRPGVPAGRPAGRWLLTAALLVGAVGGVPGAGAPPPVPPAGPPPIVTPPLGAEALRAEPPRAEPPRAAAPGAASGAGLRPGPAAGSAGVAAPADRARLRSITYAEGLPDARATLAIRAAMAQLGLPYVWGGDGPESGESGFDCSGLTHFAYAAAGIMLPRTAHTQYHVGPRVPPGAALRPGDLVFYGVPWRVHHVGLYLGDGRMVNAPTFGRPVQVAYYRWRGDDYLGATRPTGDPDDPGLLPRLPVPLPLPPLPGPRVFEAPPAPVPATIPRPEDPQPPEPVSAAAALAASDPNRAAVAPVAPAPPRARGSVPGDATVPVQAREPEERGIVPPSAPAPAAEPAWTAPAATGPASTAPGSPPSSVPPSSGAPATAPASTAPASTEPTTTGPPATTAPAPTEPAAAPATPSPPPPTEPPPRAAVTEPGPVTGVALPGGTVPVVPVAAGSDGLPAGPGVLDAPGPAVIRLDPAAADGATIGVAVVLWRSAGGAQAYTVSGHTLGTAADAARAIGAAPAGALILLAQAPDGGWTIVLAG